MPQQLPPISMLKRLAKQTHFPTQMKAIEQTAQRYHNPQSVVQFLQMFPDNEVFENRTDFMTRCEELELFMQEELDMPRESLRSEQDLAM